MVKYFMNFKQNIKRIISLLLVLVIAFGHVLPVCSVYAAEIVSVSLISQESIDINNKTFGLDIKRESFESIDFVDKIDIPENAVISWNVGIDENDNLSDKIKAWYLDNDENGLYELYIGQEGGVVLNSNSSYLFEGFTNVKYIDLSHVKFDNVEDMTKMFSKDENLEKIYVSNDFGLDDKIILDDIFVGCLKLEFNENTDDVIDFFTKKEEKEIVDDENNETVVEEDANLENKDGIDKNEDSNIKEDEETKENDDDIKQIKEKLDKLENETKEVIINTPNNTMVKFVKKIAKAPAATGTRNITVTKKWVDNSKEEIRPDSITVHLNEKVTMFRPGSELNAIMKRLSGGSTGNTTTNSIIKAITKADSLDTTKSYEEVQTSDSSYPIYMWYDNGTIYYYSEAQKVFLNPQSGYTFSYMTELQDISGLQYVDTSYVESSRDMFHNNIKLSNITPLQNWDMSNNMTMAFMFNNCISITDISALSSWNTSNVQSMKFMFGANDSYISSPYEGMKIGSLEPIKNWNVGNVSDMSYTFKGLTRLENLSGLENWNVVKVRTFEQCFSKTEALIDMSAIVDWDVSKVSGYSELKQVFYNSEILNHTMPTFTKRNGSWSQNTGSDSGTYYPTNSYAGTREDPVYTYYEPSGVINYTSDDTKWTKSGDTWTYKFTVPDDNRKYEAYEDEIEFYSSDAYESTKKQVSNDEVEITNTLKPNTRLVKVIKEWDDPSDSLRPDELTLNIMGEALKVPWEYQEVEYIQANGSQWIDTGVTLDGSYTIYGDGQCINTQNGGIIDAFESTSKRAGIVPLSSQIQVYWPGISLYSLSYTTIGIYRYDRWQFTQNKDGITFTQGNVSYTSTYSGTTDTSSTATYNLLRTVKDNYRNITFYEAKIMDSTGAVIHDYIPCYRKSDGEVGVYDIIENKFLTNSGSGTIIKGADVTSSSTSLNLEARDTKTISKSRWNVSADKWETTIAVPYDDDLYVYEDDVANYTADNSSTSPKKVENDEVTLKNTSVNEKITITKQWNDYSNDFDTRISENDFDINLEKRMHIANVEAINIEDKTIYNTAPDNDPSLHYKVVGTSTNLADDFDLLGDFVHNTILWNYHSAAGVIGVDVLDSSTFNNDMYFGESGWTRNKEGDFGLISSDGGYYKYEVTSPIYATYSIYIDYNNPQGNGTNGGKIYPIYVIYDKEVVDTNSTWSGWEKNGNTWTGTVIVPREKAGEGYYAYETGSLGEYTPDASITTEKKVTNGAVTIINRLNRYNLNVKKVVTGTMANMNDSFTFAIEFFDKDNNQVDARNLEFVFAIENSSGAITGPVGGSTSLTSAVLRISLKHGDTLKITNLPANIRYEITEADTEYIEYNKVEKTSDSTIIKANAAGLTTGKQKLEENQTVTFTNNKESATITGRFIQINRYFVITLISLFVIIYMLAYKETGKKSKKE